MIHRSHAYVRTLAVLAGTLSLCLFAAGPARADDPLTVISGSVPSAFFEVLGDVAEDAGYYKDEHLAVTVQYAGSPATAAQLIATGKGDVCTIATEPILQGYEKGLHLQAFLLRDPRYQFVLAVLDDSPIKTLADFKGATVGEISVGNPAEYSTNSLLSGAGLRKTDFSYIPIGSATQAYEAIVAKKVSAAAYPYVALASFAVFGHVKFRYFWHPILKDIGDTAYVATPATVQSKGDLLRRFARANVKAAILIRENPQLAARYFLKDAGIKATDDAIKNEVNVLIAGRQDLPADDPLSKTIGALSPLGIGVYAKFFYDSGLTTQLVPAAAIATDQFVAFANDFDHNALIAHVKTLH
jgi:NitT/TauT family transport system substrate-binding protein